MLETGTAVSYELIGIHYDYYKTNSAPGLLVADSFGQQRAGSATDAAIAGVPQEADRYVVLGGRKVTRVVGAVAGAMAVAGLETAVPPEMLADVPAPDDPLSDQVVTKVNTVLPAFSATVVRMKSGV